jgi:hypothetical protein
VRNLRDRDDLEDTEAHVKRAITKWIIEKQVWRAWIGFLWFRIGIGGGLL